MNLSRVHEAEHAIKAKIVEIASRTGDDAMELMESDSIPASGLIDSAGLLELLHWYEGHFGIELDQRDVTIDNLGSIRAMAAFALARLTTGGA